MKGRPIVYSADELAWIEANSTRVRKEMAADFSARFNRPDVTLTHLHSLCKRKSWFTGRTGCFAKGDEPHNKGKPFNPKGSEKGRFKKGHLPHNTHYLGHERISQDGYVEVSIAETNPHTGYERRYVLKHRHEWEKAHGPIPAGHALKCLSDDKTNCDPSNWEAVPRAILPLLNGGRFKTMPAYDKVQPELKPVVLATAKLRHRAKQRRAA